MCSREHENLQQQMMVNDSKSKPHVERFCLLSVVSARSGPINREMRHLISSLQNHNLQLKGDVQRYKRKLRETQMEINKVDNVMHTVCCVSVCKILGYVSVKQLWCLCVSIRETETLYFQVVPVL